MSKSARMKSSLTNRTSVFGVMGGLANTRSSGKGSMHRATSRLVIPSSAKLGMQFMKKNNLLSKNPQGSGGVVHNKTCGLRSSTLHNEQSNEIIGHITVGHEAEQCPVEYPHIAGDETQGFYCCKKVWDDGKCLDTSVVPAASDSPNMCILQSGSPTPSICDSSYCKCEEVCPSLAKKYPVLCLYSNNVANTVIRTNCGCGCIWGDCLSDGRIPPPTKKSCCSSTCADGITYNDLSNGIQTCSLGTEPNQFKIFHDLITKDTITNVDSITYNEVLMRSWVGEEFSKIPIYGFFYTNQSGSPQLMNYVINIANMYKLFTKIALPIVLLNLDDLLDTVSTNPFTDISYSDAMGNIQILYLADTLNINYNNNSKIYSTTNGVLVHVVTGGSRNMVNSNNKCDISNQEVYHLPWCPYDDQIKKAFSCSLLRKGLIPENGLPPGVKPWYPVFDTTNGKDVFGLIMKPDIS